ncbi:MAG TPA: ABC transporter permease [Thermoplasmata archaeon]|nr:ABC transporter permease [Thermoplasmata archaeon]
MKPRRIGADLQVVAKGYVRNPAALFFSLIFPLILIGLFGLIFSSTGSAVTLYTENLDHSPQATAFLAALNATQAVTVQVVNPGNESFSTWLGQNGYAVGLVVPAGFGRDYANKTPVNVTVYTDPEDAASSGVALGAVEGVVNGFNLNASCASNCVIVSVTAAQIGSQVYQYIDYLVPGLIGFSILTSPMFSMVDVASSYRKEGLFRQLSLTPLTRAEWLTSRILWYTILTFAAAGIMIGIGFGVFHAHVTLSWELLPFLVVGPFFFVSLGMLAGSAAKTPESAAVIGNIITFPMMFLSGTFFPVSEFPPGLAAFAHVLPLYYVIDGMNQVMLFHNEARAFTDLLIVVVAAVIVFLAAIRLFRWRDG